MSNQRKILHFSSGETLEVEDSTDEELSDPVPFEEPAGRVGDLLEAENNAYMFILAEVNDFSQSDTNKEMTKM